MGLVSPAGILYAQKLESGLEVLAMWFIVSHFILDSFLSEKCVRGHLSQTTGLDCLAESSLVSGQL